MECLGFSREDVARIDEYVCGFCSSRTGQKTIFKTVAIPAASNIEDSLTDESYVLTIDDSVTHVSPAPSDDSSMWEVPGSPNCLDDIARRLLASIKQRKNLGEAEQPSFIDQGQLSVPGVGDTEEREQEENQEGEQAEGPQEIEDGCFVVKEIHGHGECAEGTGAMKFLVEWEGYPEQKDWTWQFEQDLVRCYDVVASYRSKKENSLSSVPNFPQLGGASGRRGSPRYNLRNWVDLPTLTRRAKQFLRHKKYASSLSLYTCHSAHFIAPKKDSIVMMLHQSHYYCMLWLVRENRAYISDGANLSQEGQVLVELMGIVGVDLLPVQVSKKTKVDYCAASCIACGMEYARAYRTLNMGTRSMMFSDFYYNRLVQVLHRERSNPERGRKDIRVVRRSLTCDFCGVYRTTKGRGALLSHQRQAGCSVGWRSDV